MKTLMLISVILLVGACARKGCPNCGEPLGVITKHINGKQRTVPIRANCSNCQMPIRSAVAAGDLVLEDYGFEHIWKQYKIGLIVLAVCCVGAMMEWLKNKGGKEKHPKDTNEKRF
jgi:hypothetical protein